jgi:hypothetical protein
MLKLLERQSDSMSFLNTRVEPHIRILNGALDESDDSAAGLILNGRVDASTLRFLKVDTYQRPLEKRADITSAFIEGKIVPNIQIGVRGQDFESDGADFIIRSPAFIIDGWQRVGNALRLLEDRPDFPIRLFASLHFGTDEIWERHRFNELSKNVKRLKPSLILKNERDTNEALLALYALCDRDPSFALHKKVCWSQSMLKGELINAMTLVLTVQQLHMHRAPFNGVRLDVMSKGLALLMSRITKPTFQRNVHTFFQIVNECWPLGPIQYRRTAPQVKSAFLYELARLFSAHSVFWQHNENTLFITQDDLRKLAKFPINDPRVVQLAGSGGAARRMLYQLLVDHMNSGRRTQRLRARDDVVS